MCEVSRLAVAGMFRRRSGEGATRFRGVHISELWQQGQRTFPLVAVSCFLAASIIAHGAEHTSLFARMDPFLPRLPKRPGIIFTKIGQDIDYHGMRASYYVKTPSFKNGFNSELAELYDAILSLLSS